MKTILKQITLANEEVMRYFGAPVLAPQLSSTMDCLGWTPPLFEKGLCIPLGHLSAPVEKEDQILCNESSPAL